jgi:hypothetical protein
MKLADAQPKILSGPDDNVDRLCTQKDKQIAAGVDCKVVYLEDIEQFAVIRVD